MIRLTKPLNYLHFSPSKAEVAQQKAPECIQLVMEPRSLFYADPIIVLDFQSLYPSIVIAYNMCYSTCLGKAAPGEGLFNSKKFGASRLSLPRGLLKVLEQYITITTNEVMFLKRSLHKGIVPQMLSEILETRVMVKQSMKRAKDNPVLSLMQAVSLLTADRHCSRCSTHASSD